MCQMATTGMREHAGRRFHERHGVHIDLLRDRTVAVRRTSFANSIVFSDAALEPKELFLVEIDRNENGWNGHMRMGLTRLDPAALSPLPPYALPNLTADGGSWIFGISQYLDLWRLDWSPSTRPLTADDGEESGLCLPGDGSPLPTEVGSRIGVYYRLCEGGATARMHFVINGMDLGPRAEFPYAGFPLFAVMDVYGTTKQIKIVLPKRSVEPLQQLCRLRILKTFVSLHCVDNLPLPVKLKLFLKTGDYQHSMSTLNISDDDGDTLNPF